MLHKLLVTLKTENKPSLSGLVSNRNGGPNLGSGGPTQKFIDHTSLELINEEANTGGQISPIESSSRLHANQDSEGKVKGQSLLTKTLLSNFLLGISLMKNIALKFTNPVMYQTESLAQISRILEIESRYGLNSSAPEIGISFLVNQHIKEILEKYENSADVV